MNTATPLEINDLMLSENDRQNVIASLTELRDKHLAYMRPNTRKAYLSDFRHYLRFCHANELPPLASDWRVTKDTIEHYIEHMIAATYVQHNAKKVSSQNPKTYKHSGIKRKLASIRFFIGISELPDPFKQSKLLNRFVSDRLRTKASAPKQAHPIRLRDIQKLNMTMTPQSLMDYRDLAIINTGWDTLLRASNLAEIELAHVDFSANTIHVPRSKTDQSGRGHYAYISNETIALLQTWITKANIQEGYLFRCISPKHTIRDKALTTRMLWQIYRRLGKWIDKNINFSCHSTRTGAVVTMAEQGVPLTEMVLAGDWASPAMPAHYARQVEASKTGMSKIR